MRHFTRSKEERYTPEEENQTILDMINDYHNNTK